MTTLIDQYGRPIDRSDLEEREDSWANLQTGIGVRGVDKTRAGTYLPVWRVLDQELTSLMNGSDIARKIVSKRPEEMFRRGFAIEGDGIKQTDNDAIRDFCTDHLRLETNFLEGKRWGRLYGGSLLIMGIDDGRMPWEPLDEDNIRSFDSLSLVDRRYSFVQSQYAAMGTTSKYGSAQIYLISNAVAGYGWDAYGAQKIDPKSANDLIKQGAQVVLVHESRVIRFDGNPADIITRQNLAGWSWSVLQVVYDAMRQFDQSFDSAAYLLSDASQGVFKLQGLMKAISSGNRANFAMRLQLLEQSRSVLRGIALDAGTKDGAPTEDFTRVPTPFGGIPDLLDKMMLRMSSAADMPATELFGRAPAGLNATGDSDTRKWYDSIASEQENDVSPQLKRVFKLVALAKKGPLRGRRVKWKIKWRPLWSPTDKETSDTRLSNAQRDQIYVQNGIVKPEEVAIGLTDVYPNMDVESREEALEAGLLFDPYENQPAPTISANISGQHEGEPLSSKAPVPLMGTTGTQITRGALPAVAAAMQAKGVAASHGAQSPATGGLGEPSKATVRPTPGPTHANPSMTAAQREAEGRARDKEEAGAKGKDVPTKGQKGEAENGRKLDAAEPDGNVYEKDASIVLVWQAPGELLTVNRPDSEEMAIPGGHVDPGETPAHAGIRELHEECGILVSELKSHGFILSPDGTRVHVFTAGRWEGVPRPAELGTRIAWLAPAALMDQATTLKRCLFDLLEAGLLKAPLAPGGAAPGRPKAIARPTDAPDGRRQVAHFSEENGKRDREDAVDREATLTLDALTATRPDRDVCRSLFGWLLADYRSVMRSDESDAQARRVYQQLGEDYPLKLLGWVLSGHWSLREVPLDEIDSSNRDKWTASHDGKLESFRAKLRDGIRKPAVLVKVPGETKYKIVDGHHRYLAHEAEGMPLLAYVAEMHVSRGPWDSLHDAQTKGRSGPSYQGPSWQGANKPGGESVAVGDRSDDAGDFRYRPGATVPKDGFMVSLPPSNGLNHIVDSKSIASHATSEKALREDARARLTAHLEKTAAFVQSHPGHFVGGYVEKDDHTGKPVALHLDVSEHIPDQDKAVAAGRARNQISIWDLKNQRETKTGGTGR